MVQRAKGVGKLGIPADHVKSEKLSTSLKLSGSLHQDGKTKAADCFKRKMKKSRSLSLDGFNPSPPSRKTSPPHPGRPPPTALPPPIVGALPRQSESRVKARHVLPNYMKSTSSSDARKENSQVSHLQSTPSGSAAKVSRRRCSTGSPRPTFSSGSGKYSSSSNSRTLKRSSSSLKLVRTLTKSPCFKPARSTSAKKCTQVVVCADSSIQKATCSSTLKETKYPEYLMLNPGGTEAEGTSIFKVCPYTYCSLNGHRHAQLPPLKRFVAARRRLLKAQKSAKVVPVSPDSFCRRSQGDKPACIELDFESDFFFVEIYAKSEKEGSLNIGEDVCGSEGEDDRSSLPSDEGSCENGEDGLKGGIDLDKSIEYRRDATETEMNSGSDNISREKEETDTRDLDEVYSLIMIQKERICRNRSLSQCDVNEDELFEDVEDLNVCSADSTDDDWDEVDNASSELKQGEALSMTEAEGGHDKDTIEYKEEQKQEDKELRFCNAGLQEDGMDPVSDCSKSNEAVEGVAVVEIGDSAGECSQIESEVSSEEIDGDDIVGAQTLSTGRILQTEAEEAGTITSRGDDCFEPQVDAFPPKDSLTPPQGLAEEIEVTAEPLICAESIILEEVGLQDEEETGAAEQASDSEIPTEQQIPGNSSEDPGEADRSIANLELVPGQENDESSLLISTTSDGSGDADNLEGFSTGELHLSNHTGQSEKVDGNKAAELSTASSVLNGTTSMSNQLKDRYLRGKGNYREELSDTCMIWRINRREKCDVPDEELRGFNPRDPNYLPIVPDPDAEKVDLRHQMIDDRRNSEEWMIDYALQRTVSKLASAREKKVELLVEAFEKVMPVSQFETHIKSSSTGITQGRPIQACS